MNCAIINQTTHTIIGRDNTQTADKSQFSGSALQNPDISRMTLGALLRREMRTKTASAPTYWSHFLSRNAVANANNSAAE